MKQQLLLIIFTLFIGATPTQSQESLTHKILEDYDFFSDEFTESWKEEYSYNNKGQLIETNGYYKNAVIWELGSRFNYTYDIDGNIIETIHSNMNYLLNEMEYSKREVISYANGLMTQRIEYEWVNGQWVQYEKTEFTSGTNTIEKFSSYEWKNMAWVEDLRGILTYDEGRLITVTTQEFDDGEWDFDEKTTFNRNATNGRIEEIISQEWNGTSWSNYEKITYTLDTKGNRLMEVDSESEDGLTWEEDDKTEYTYDMTKLMSNYYHPFNVDPYSRNLGINDMPHYNKILSSVESDNKDTLIPVRGNASWEVESKTTYYYSDDTLGVQYLSQSDFITVYPNPVKNRVHIKLKNQVEADVILFDINGKKVLEQRIQALNTSLNFENINPGVYILKIKADNGFATKRITKQ